MDYERHEKARNRIRSMNYEKREKTRNRIKNIELRKIRNDAK